MSLSINEREVEGIWIFDLDGRLVAGPDEVALRERFTNLDASGRKNVILNLKKVDYIDSTGLGTLVVSHSRCKRAGGALKLVNLSKRSAELLILTKLSTIFDMFSDEQAAINSFFPEREVKPFDILEFVRGHREEKD